MPTHPHHQGPGPVPVDDLLRSPWSALDARPYLDEYLRTQWLTAEEPHERQLTALRRLVWHCVRHVPRLAAEIVGRISESRVAHIESPAELPVQRAGARRRSPEEFVAAADLPIGARRETAGTHGEPQPVKIDNESCLRQVAVRMRAERWAGAPPARIVDIDGHDLLHEPCPLDDQQLEVFASRLAIGSPAVVTAPATAYARLCALANLRPDLVRAVIARGEDPEGAARAFAERVGAPLYSWYAAAETGVIASPCESTRGTHVHADHLLVEIVDVDDRPVAVGTTGRIVVTDLFNQAAPYLRHELGDVGRFLEERCACGRALPLIELWGRTN